MRTPALPRDRMEHFTFLGLQTASLVHEMNNRLAAMVGALELISLGAENASPRCRETCRRLKKAQDGIVELVREAGAIAAGRTDACFKTESVTIQDLVERIHETTQGSAVVGTEGLVVTCNLGKASRALADLVRNAWQAGAKHVRLDIRRRGPDAQIRIIDDGPGIPPQIAEDLFQPGTTHGKPHGQGIGLFSARWILRAMGGDLQLESTGSGGTVFLAHLPLADRES